MKKTLKKENGIRKAQKIDKVWDLVGNLNPY